MKAVVGLSLPIMAEHLGDRARRGQALYRQRPVGGGRGRWPSPGRQTLWRDHPAAVLQAHGPALDELVRDPDHGDAAGVAAWA